MPLDRAETTKVISASEIVKKTQAEAGLGLQVLIFDGRTEGQAGMLPPEGGDRRGKSMAFHVVVAPWAKGPKSPN